MNPLALRPTGTRPYLVEVAGGVFGYVQPHGGWCVSNAGVITGGGQVAVVDTTATAARAQALRDTVSRLGAGEVRTLVNTHFHGDHTFGNQFFAAASIIGHRLAREEMIAAGFGLTNLWPDVDWGELRLTPPTVVFDTAMTVHLGDRRIDLIHVGPAHTTNDVVVWLPAERVLFTGDVVLSGATPFTLMGSVSGSLGAVERLAALRPDVVVTGHGAVCGAEVFAANAAYLRWLTDLAATGHSAGLAPLGVARECDLGEFADLLDAERIVGNLHRAYAELDGAAPGAPIDVVAAMGEIFEFNGGRRPDCLA